MAQPFLRIDLSNQARDFQNTVIEAGWPLIDKANANYQILRKWLGAQVAEPERQGEEVLFYLRNEAGARIDEPNVLKATDKDLMGPLKSDFQTLVKTLQSAEPKNSSEKTLHAKALQELQSLATEKRASDRRCCLFKYRDDNKKWHLVWAPGYRRKDEHPANPVICTNPTCSLLFLQRADGNAKCPRCQKTPSVRPVDGRGVRKSRLPLALVLLLLMALLGGAGWWYYNRDGGETIPPIEAKLAVSPASATITQDGLLEYTATFTDAEGNEKDVTKDVSVVVRSQEENEFAKTPVKYDIFHNKAQANGVGTAELEFFYLDENSNKYTAIATLTVEPRRNPKVVTIEPASVKLGIGTTAQLKMMGEYEDGRKEDLTQHAEWNWDDPGQTGSVFAYKGAIQGLNKGKTTLKARYRATPESEYLIAEAEVEVDDIAFKTLHLSLASEKVQVGKDPGVTVEVVSEDGEKMSVLGSALLKLEVTPQELADVQKQPPYLYPLQAGEGTLKATFRGITQEIPFVVEAGSGSEALEFQVNPQNLKLAVGEIADVEVPRAGAEVIRFSSSDLNIVEVTPHNRLIGKQPGTATVTVQRGDQSATVNVEVAAVAFTGLAFDPSEVSVRVDDVVALRLLAQIDEDTQVEIDPLSPLLEWVRFPAGEYVELNQNALDVRGLMPTGEDQKTLTVRLGEQEATAKIRVIPGPLTLALEPAEDLEVPVGQKQVLKVFATYGNGQREEIPASRVEWIANSAEGLTLQNGEVSADKPQAGPLTVSVKYQDQTSNEVQIRSSEPIPLRLSLAARPAQLAVGETGQLVLSAQTPGGQEVALDMAGVKFETGDPSIVPVDPVTGGFRAEREGQVMVTATHPSSRDAVTASIEVTAAAPAMPLARPEAVRIITDAPQPIVLPVGVVFRDFQVEADIAGQPRDVTRDSVITVDGEPESAAVSVSSEGIAALRPGEAVIKAQFAGQAAENTLTVQVVEKLELDGIELEPKSLTLAVGENTRLEAVGLLKGRRVGFVTDHPEITWKSSAPQIVQAESPVIAAVAEGQASVTAHFQSVASQPADVRVVGEGAPLTEGLTLSPASITLRPGESIDIGRGVRVLRGRADLSSGAVVASADPEIVSYNEITHSLKAGLPGQTRVTLAVGEQTADFAVTVLAEAPHVAGARVVIEPNSRVIAVAEQLPLDVYLITADGERINMTESALLSSSDPAIAAPARGGVRGVAPGTATISAQVAGVDTPGTATFEVQNIEFTRLEVHPARIDLAVGQETRLEIRAVGPGGRRILGADPDLTITEVLNVGQENERRTEVSADSRIYEGNVIGDHAVEVKWRNLEVRVPCKVTDGQIDRLVIRPADGEIGQGDTLDYLVFAERGGRLDPLSNVDGVELSVTNSAVASKAGGLRVRGETVGTTEVIAQFAGKQARARLRVGPRTVPVAPAGRPIGLRFVRETARLGLDSPDTPVRLVRISSDGTSEDVAHLAEFTPEPEGIVEIQNIASGPVLRPKSIGQTRIHAQVGDLKTQTPLLVAVTETPPTRPRLVAASREIRVNVGERKTLGRVVLVSGQGGEPVSIPYKITAPPNDFFTIENDRAIRGTAPGQATATVVLDDPDNKSNPHPETVIITVTDPAARTVVTHQSELELSGPHRTTEGSEVDFHVHLTDGGSVRDVTNDATLVLAAGDEQLAELLPGGRLIAKKPGAVTVQATHAGKVSNTIRLRIGPLATQFRRLELAINTEPIGVGETRGYQVWGYPEAGGPRQDLTRLVTNDENHPTRPHIRLSVLKPEPNANVADHNSPHIIGRNPGTMAVEAAIGDRLVSNREELSVVGAIQNPLDLRLVPEAITSKVGETTPPFKVLVRTAGANRYREVDPTLPELKFESQDTDILMPVPDAQGRFTAKSPGTTRIKVEFGGLEASANVTVVSDRFKTVTLGKIDVGFDTFQQEILITTDRIAGPLEYRLYPSGKTPEPQAGWKSATPQGNEQSVTLTTEELRLVGTSQFRFMLESRTQGDESNQSIDRYPYMFSITPQGGREN